MLRGVQQPRVEVVPPGEAPQAEDAALFAAAYGLTPDAWQERVLHGWLAERDGVWAASRAGLAVPRQNGKNAALEIRELFGMVALGEKVLHTAHEVKTARKAFMRLVGFFENAKQWPELAALVKSIRRTNGQEAIELHNGASVEFVARTRGSGRGYTVDVLVCDEAQELTDEQLEALLPTISSAPTGNPQVVYTGTPPRPDSQATVLRRIRDTALAGESAGLSWHEWSVVDPFDIDDRALWAATNPALGGRLHWSVLEDERAQMSDDGFARERLGYWGTNSSQQVIDGDLWESLADPEPPKSTDTAIALDVTPDRARATVAFAGLRPDGRRHVEVVANRPRTGWIVDEAAALRMQRPEAPVVLDASGPAGSLITALQARGIEPVVTGAREMAQACGAFFDAAQERTLTHYAQPALNSALGGATKRNLGDAWAWHRRDTTVDISPLVAVTLALHGLDSIAAAPKQRSGKVW